MNHNECKELKKYISEYLDGDLNEELCQEIERHLSDCKECQIVINTYKKTIELSKKSLSCEQEQLPEDVRKRLFKCLDLMDYIEDK